jgi:hypothetical protein
MMMENPIIQWKGATFQELSAGVKFNAAPSVTTTSIFAPNPLRIYRREIASTALTRCNPRTSIKIDDYDRPGGILANTISTTTGLANTGDLIYEKNTCEHPSSDNLCAAFMSPADNARRRVRSSGMIKKQSAATSEYYTSSKQYLNSRNISYEQNLYFHVKYGVSTAKPGSSGAVSNIYQSNGINKCKKYSIATATTFTYYWVDDTANVVTVPAGLYDIDDFNSLLQNAMVANYHFYTTATLTKVFLLSMGYDSGSNTIIITANSNNTTQYPSSTYSLPLHSPPSTWDASGNKIPGILVPNSIIANALGFAINTSITTYPVGDGGGRISTTNQSVQGSFSPGLQPRYTPIYYKPSNPQFGVQGAVSSSDRLARKKYDTITTVGSSFRSAFGAQTANALAYGSSMYGYTLKERTGYSMKKTPTFSKYSSEMKQCSVTKFANAI